MRGHSQPGRNGQSPRNHARTLLLPDSSVVLRVFGTRDKHLRLIGNRFGVDFSLRQGALHVEGSEVNVQNAESVLRKMIELVTGGGDLADSVVNDLVDACSPAGDNGDSVGIDLPNFRARTDGQLEYLEKMAHHDVVFCVGPAGTGKTFLAVVKAVSLLKKGTIEKIVLVRPAVEAGEKLGFLPGDLQAKVHPYLRPLFAALFSLLGYESAQKLIERGTVEITPLAYMRGQTLERSFVILDEGQNTTREQMKMFLTRMGCHSKVVVTGDETQIDLRPVSRSGLVHARKILKGIAGIAVQEMKNSDIVRHRLVWKIVDAYAASTSET